MTIQIEDVTITKRWKTVEDMNKGFSRIRTMFDACEMKDKVLGLIDSKKVLLRIKRHLGFYLIQARLRTQPTQRRSICPDID